MALWLRSSGDRRITHPALIPIPPTTVAMALRCAVYVAAVASASAAFSGEKLRKLHSAVLNLHMQLPDSNVSSQGDNSTNFVNVSLGQNTSQTLHVAMHNLLADLATIDTQTKETFMGKCMVHVQSLVSALDRSYGDMQLETVLVNECKAAEEFPTEISTGFHNISTCEDFAKKLTLARMHELQSGHTDKYHSFCKDYYDLKVKTKKAAEKGAAAPRGYAFALSLVVALVWSVVRDSSAA